MGKRYYDNYDYEEAYKEQCKKLEEAEMERWMKEGCSNEVCYPGIKVRYG